jgi:hypothetical protein
MAPGFRTWLEYPDAQLALAGSQALGVRKPREAYETWSNDACLWWVGIAGTKTTFSGLSELEVGQKQAVLFRHIQPMRVNNHLTRFLSRKCGSPKYLAVFARK